MNEPIGLPPRLIPAPTTPDSSWPGLSRPSTPSCISPWMPGTRPGMTGSRVAGVGMTLRSSPAAVAWHTTHRVWPSRVPQAIANRNSGRKRCSSNTGPASFYAWSGPAKMRTAGGAGRRFSFPGDLRSHGKPVARACRAPGIRRADRGPAYRFRREQTRGARCFVELDAGLRRRLAHAGQRRARADALGHGLRCSLPRRPNRRTL